MFPNHIKDSQDITRNQMILQSVNDTYRSSNLMGFLGYGEERLVIESRFANGKDDYLFQYLLESVMDFPNIINLEIDAMNDDRMFSMLVFLFPLFLTSAMRKGLFKTYVHREYNDANIKGTININRHIKENTPFIGKIAYAQREYAYDNYLTQLVRHTIEYIKSKPYGNRLLANVKDGVELIVGTTASYKAKDTRKVIINNKNNLVRHAYYYEYRALQRLYLLILQNKKSRVGVGTNKVYGILVDGAWLWEEYINSLVNGMFYHPMNKGGKGAQWLFYTENGNVGLIYPDFIGKCEDQRIIADAKYKPDRNIGNKDYLQVLAYMYRFNAKKAFYFYPEIGETTDMTLFLNSGVYYEKNVQAQTGICLIKHGLIIPSGVDDYKEFVAEIKKSEKRFLAPLT